MKVLKFGGGCLKDAKSIKKLPKILSNYPDNLVIVLSAFGKITNMLENNKYEDVFSFVQSIMIDLGFSPDEMKNVLNKKKIYLNFSNQLSYPERVSIGEYLSSEIIKIYLKSENLDNIELDAAKHIFTESWNHELNAGRFHSINVSGDLILSMKNKMIITQGFIASDINSLSSQIKITTLGREGSDYSAAIFGAALDADEVVLFKDVDGVYSMDPKQNPNAKLFSHLTYDEAFELCSNGSAVVHPKTINHLKQKKIPLLIKNFNDLSKPGTEIS